MPGSEIVPLLIDSIVTMLPMETLLHLFTWYPLFGIPAGVGWMAVWVSAGNKRIDLQRGDKELLYLPWLVLYGCSVLLPLDKTLANFAEILLLAACVPLALIFRTIKGRVDNQARFARQIVTSAMSAGGDSGSLLLDMDNRAVGLLFAGSPTVTPMCTN